MNRIDGKSVLNNLELGKFRENKKTFLEDNYDNEKTQLTYGRLFKLFIDTEDALNKELALFNREELLQVIGSIPTYSKRTINTLDSLLTNYMAWATQRGINPTGVNPMQSVNVKDHLEKNINTNLLSKRFVTKEDLYSIASKCENVQDAVCVLLPFYGVYGQNCSEIINLKWENVKEEQNEIHIITENDEEPRFVKVDKELIEYLKKADKEFIYHRDKAEGEMPLIDNGYILKVPNRKNNTSDKISPVTIRQRMQKVMSKSDKFKLVTMKSLVTSGKFHKLEEIKAEKGTLTDEDFRNVVELFSGNKKSYFTLKEDYYFVNKAD